MATSFFTYGMPPASYAGEKLHLSIEATNSLSNSTLPVFPFREAVVALPVSLISTMTVADWTVARRKMSGGGSRQPGSRIASNRTIGGAGGNEDSGGCDAHDANKNAKSDKITRGIAIMLRVICEA